MMNRPQIYEDSVPIVYATPSPTYFSPLIEQHLGLELKWQRWHHRFFELRQDATLVVRHAVKGVKTTILAKYDLSTVTVTHLAYKSEAVSATNPLIKQEIGILLEVKTSEGHGTQIRFIMSEDEQSRFYNALRGVAKQHNLDAVKHASITAHVADWQTKAGAKTQVNQSVMRSAIAQAMDTFDDKTRKAEIVNKRGALTWLPVFFANDLVHGSWWFVIGSVFFVISSLVTLINSFSKDLGDDDSILTDYQYRATWLLMTISGVFCTLGSLAFMRAVHEDPPMKPLFASWYHLQSDELLGSWLFLCATLPIIPYSLIYISASGEQLVYLGALAVSILLVIGTYLFVRACYPNPSQKKRMQVIQPVANFLCGCFCSKEWRAYHLSNDWLAGTWFIYWGTLLAFVVCFVLLFVAIADKNSLLVFIYGTGFFENFCFLVGSAYFVAGSYPEDSEENEDDVEEGGVAGDKFYDAESSFLCFKWQAKKKASDSETIAAPFL